MNPLSLHHIPQEFLSRVHSPQILLVCEGTNIIGEESENIK